ncbi:response regulator transcription factor [Erysipelothrix tonsillarum]|uniref:response regulator transcription factor n=1 Tax=Erysipelothrix tonsillarum TaxID=38402 RepID=UPI00037C20C9|nr:response regulator transcription factor [Erysipelothrix tonsillarum]
MKKILIIEDEQELNQLLQTVLKDDYELTAAYSGTEALLHHFESFDLILLDYMLPGMCGDQVLQTIRETSNVPIMMITSVSNSEMIVSLLSMGANDYITKPFDINVLKARIAVQLRTEHIRSKNQFINLAYDMSSLNYKIHGHELILTKKEIDLLNLLLEHPKQTFTKEAIYEVIWGDDYMFDDNSINVLISGLRKKIRLLDPDHEYIQTIWGVGVRLARVEL